MGKSKEEDRIEKLIRGLLKLPHNRRCMNCNSLGPQYVCTTFWTFVCTNCSGVHREFTHRVKSISMAKFNLDEVNALQSGGNERAREIYFKTWDPVRNFFPDNSKIHRLRALIKSVYVDRLFTADYNHQALVERSKKSDKDKPYESTSGSSGEKSFFRDRALDRYGRHSYKEGRNGGFVSENDRYGISRKGSSHFQSTDSRYCYQADGSKIVGRSATQMFTTADITPKKRSPDRCYVRDSNSPPPVRHISELLGEKVITLHIETSPKVTPNGQVSDHPKDVDSPEGNVRQSGDHSRTNRKASVSTCGSNNRSKNQISDNKSALKPKNENPGSSIGIATSFPDPTNRKEEQKSRTSTEGGKSDSSVPPPAKETTSNAPPKNVLEFLLFELSTPADTTPKDGGPTVDDTASYAPSHNSLTLPQSSVTVPSQDPGLSKPKTLEIEMVPSVLSNGGDSSGSVLALASPDAHDSPSISTSTSNDTVKCERSGDVGASPQMVLDLFGVDVSTVEGHKNQPSSVQQPKHCIAIDSDSSSPALQTCHLNQPTNDQSAALALVPCGEVPNGSSSSQNPNVDQCSTQEMKSAMRTQFDGRKELPADLFTSLYPPRSAAPFPGWQMGPSFNMGVNMHRLPAPMNIPAFQETGKSRNPFDINDNTGQHHIPTFPSSTSVQGGLPNVSTPPGMMQSSGSGSLVQSFPPNQTASYPSGAYTGQQLCNNNLPSSRQQHVSGVGGGVPGSMNPTNPNAYGYSVAPANPSSFLTSRGNPFG